ncbi:MAG: hypothetical protein ACYSU7_07020 [Planctomycetota bacterium]|jgi:hypothetical protein
MRCNLAALAALAATVTLGSAVTRSAEAAGDALVVYSGGLEKLLVDDKDQGLLEALRLLDNRLVELPAELDRGDIPVPMIQLALDLLGSPFLIQAGAIDNAEAGNFAPFHAQIALEEPKFGPAFADRADQILGMMGQGLGQPVQNRPGVRVMDLDEVQLFYGPTGPGVFTLALNRITEVPQPAPNPGLPAGVEPVMAFAFDGPAAQPFFQMMLDQMGPERKMVREQLELYGLLGPEASSFAVAVGHGDDRAHGAWRYTNYVPMARRWHALVEGPITRRDLAMVPVDATFAEVGRYDISGLGEMLRQWVPAMEEMELEDPFGLFAQHTGVDLERDLLTHFGDSYGFYLSDTTGGGGFMSSVLFLEVTGPEALDDTLQRLAEKVNTLARQHAKGYIQMRFVQREGVDLTTLTFPGLPVPLEISWTISGGYLIAGATPHAVIAAVAQAAGESPTILENPSFLKMGGENWRDAIYLTFTDVPRLARSGYGLAQLACSSLANGVRSPANPQRDPGLVLPSFNELMNGAKASVSMYRLDGDDLVGSFQADRSVMVNLCGGLGMVGQSATTIGMAGVVAGVMLPAVGKARENAKAMKSAAQVRELAVAMMIYAADNDDAAPPDLKALADYIDPRLLHSPFGPVSDGRGDFWMNTSLKRLSQSRFPDQQVAFYDRAMYEHSHELAVGFFDGHIQVMDTWEFETLIEEEANAGTDFDLPEGW